VVPSSPAAASPSYSIERAGRVVRLTGSLRTSDAATLHRELSGLARDGEPLSLDLSGVTALDGNVAALLTSTRARIEGAEPRIGALVELYAGDANASAASASSPAGARRRRPESAVAQIGRAAVEKLGDLRAVVAFFGEMVVAAAALVRRPRSGHWAEVPPLVERTGADAVPIVVLINFLVGFVMAYQAANQLRMFGANIYVADLVGLSVTRELGPLMTAIIVCGRSGAAFAAEIGTMKVGEEIDALRTFGLRPFAWLVVPRVVALVVVLPILTLVADIVGILGGVFVGVTSLDLTVSGYIIETRTAVTAWDFEYGLLKSVAFALAIALIACQQGFSTTGGAEGVGRRTTSTVVTSLFALVLLDAVFTVAYQAVGL
jgi:phospholipid/cholesterol/gamma-HCH transport system permease protein